MVQKQMHVCIKYKSLLVLVWFILYYCYFDTLSAQPTKRLYETPQELTQKTQKSFIALWEEGLFLQTPGEEIKLRVNGLLQFDAFVLIPSDQLETVFGSTHSNVLNRRFQLAISGPLSTFWNFKVQFELARQDVRFLDMFVQRHSLPYVGTLTFGKFTVPFGLEELISSRFTTFQERSLLAAFAPGSEIGLKLDNTFLNRRMSWAFSASSRAQDETSFDVAGEPGDLSFAWRLTGLPWLHESRQRLFHLGLAYNLRRPADGKIRYRTRPEVFSDDLRFVDTGQLDVHIVHQFGIEVALVHGPWSIQSEAMVALIQSDNTAADNTHYVGVYILTSYFLTGEYRPYNPSTAAFGRPPVPSSVLRGGWGTWELAVRLSYLDLDDAFGIGTITTDAGRQTGGGKELNLTLGVNWYAHSHIRVTLNYVLALVDRHIIETNDAGLRIRDANFTPEPANIVMLRLQADF